ncbi:hypothetical protein [Bacillus sp. FJAT-45350]|uniref:hypothetical protein n=1 Tax=Bacillus sp. FJAT-45350 TaxID=2011014 RepID=UPI000BB8209E|nr:hypothetical protein [Bacillus sp. FJAT-45350]
MFKSLRCRFHYNRWKSLIWAYFNLTILSDNKQLEKAEYHKNKFIELGGSPDIVNWMKEVRR